jgi:hypothetical protein
VLPSSVKKTERKKTKLSDPIQKKEKKTGRKNQRRLATASIYNPTKINLNNRSPPPPTSTTDGRRR